MKKSLISLILTIITFLSVVHSYIQTISNDKIRKLYKECDQSNNEYFDYTDQIINIKNDSIIGLTEKIKLLKSPAGASRN
jgi:hypothetical protein